LLITQFSGLTFSAQVRDAATLSRTIDPLMKIVNGFFEVQQSRLQAQGNPAGAKPLAFRKQEGPRPAYVMDLPAGLLPPPFATLFQPTVVLGKDQLVLAASPKGAERAAGLSSGPPERRWRPAGAFVPVLRRLPSNLVYLQINDPRSIMPAMIDALPILVQQINAESARAQRRGGPGVIRQPALALRIDPDTLPESEELSRLLF